MTDISVVLPVFNGAAYLAAALESILAQTITVSEIIVVDDGSTDQSGAIAAAASPLVRVIGQENQGTATAVNHGVGECRSDWVAFLDADDLWHPTKLEWQIAAAQAQPAREAIFGYAEQFISPELSPEEARRLKFDPTPVPAYILSSLLVQRKSWQRVGPLDPGLKVGEFVEWYSRALRLDLRTHLIPELVLRRRLHLTNKSRLNPAARKDFLTIAQRAISARRKADPDADA